MHLPLRLELRPSRGVMASVLLVHVAAALTLFHVLAGNSGGAAGWSAALTAVFLGGALAASLVQALRGERRRAGQAVTLAADGGATLIEGKREVACRVRPGAVDFGWAVWMTLEPVVGERPGERPRARAMMLVPANLPPRCWRPLRIWLRHRAGAAAVG